MARTTKFNKTDLPDFCQSLASLLKTGFPLNEALESAAKNVSSPGSQAAVQRLARDIASGKNLDSALDKHQEFFPPSFLAMVRVGLDSHDLTGVLQMLAKTSLRMHRIRASLTRAMIYPLLVLSLLTIFIALCFFVYLPSFEYFFESTAMRPEFRSFFDLQGSRLALAGIGLGTVLALLGIVIVLVWRRSGEWLILLPKFLQVPFARWHVSLFLYEFSLMLRSGVSMVPALRMVARSFGKTVIGKSLSLAADRVQGGESPMRVLPEMFFLPGPVRILLAGRGSAVRLSESLGQAAQIYENDLELRQKAFAAVIEDVIFIILGLAVAASLAILWRNLILLPEAAGYV